MTHREQHGVHFLYHSLWGSFGGRFVYDVQTVSNLSLLTSYAFVQQSRVGSVLSMISQ